MVVLRMLSVNGAIASPAEMTVMSFGGGEVLTQGWTSILGSHIVETPQESTAPYTTMSMLVHGLYVREHFQTVAAAEGLEGCGRVEILKMVLFPL